MTDSQTGKRVRYAIVGAGNIAQVAVLPAFENAKNSELVALVSGNADKRAKLKQRYPSITATGEYTDLERVLAEVRVDAVYIATPNNQHRELTERAAKVGVHVLCEKPMAVTAADCEAMIAACRRHHVKLMIAYRLHFEAANLTAIADLQAGAIGDPRIFSSVFSQQVRPDDIRTHGGLAGGAIYDMGVYPINAARYLFREEPIEVSATISSSGDHRFQGVDETTTAVLRFASGRVAQLTVSLGAAAVDHYDVVGTEGDLHAGPIYGFGKALRYSITRDGKTTEKEFRERDQFAPELIEFSRCILEDREPVANGQEGLADIRIVEAILRSARDGVVVKLEPLTIAQRPDIKHAMELPPVDKPEPIDAPSPTVS